MLSGRRLSRNLITLLFFWQSLLPLSGSAAANLPWQAAEFCSWAQGVIAQSPLRGTVGRPPSFEAFAESKASSSPLLVQQYSSNPDAATGMPKVVSCKMRTAERLIHAHGTGAAGEDQSCDAVHRAMLDALLTAHAGDSLPPRAGAVKIAPEELAFTGSGWLSPWPFEPLSVNPDGTVTVHSRGLYVPHAWWIPMPERFKGNYYCHLIAPAYLESLLSGQVLPRVSEAENSR